LVITLASLNRTLVTERLTARVLAAFAMIALLLAAVGLYGVLAYMVGRRTNEIGVRLLNGVTPSDARVLSAVVTGLVVVAMAAAAIPAWRASRVNPVIALRSQ
jgi:ABC-type antimicrobial peptide transport system permease subunit